VELCPDLDPAVLAWGPLSGQRLACLSGSAAALQRSLRRATADTLALIIEDPRCSQVVSSLAIVLRLVWYRCGSVVIMAPVGNVGEGWSSKLLQYSYRQKFEGSSIRGLPGFWEGGLLEV
jgi:hypothetical protein